MAGQSFVTSNFTAVSGPVVLSVPHAGRDYDPAVVAQLRVPLRNVVLLEDRYADTLVDKAVAAGTATIISRIPRLMIDLNRAPDEIDHGWVRGGWGRGAPPSTRVRSGLGLVPTRLATVGPIWRAPIDHRDIAARVRDIHTPYHAAVGQALAAAHRLWGGAVLVDVHSMPPMKDPDAPEIVIGDRFGTSAHGSISAAAESLFRGAGFRVGINAPYAGGYIIGRHARPESNIHAIQVEVDRRLYLDAALDQPGPGLARLQTMICALVEALMDELSSRVAVAAE